MEQSSVGELKPCIEDTAPDRHIGCLSFEPALPHVNGSSSKRGDFTGRIRNRDGMALFIESLLFLSLDQLC